MNAAFVGGGVSAIVGLGAYTRLVEDGERRFSTFSGTSIGSIIATLLAAEKSGREILHFFEENVTLFCLPIIGRYLIERKVNQFLNGIRFCDLPNECEVAITPLRKKVPQIITKENAKDLTAARVVAMSSTYVPIFLPCLERITGKWTFVIDGGVCIDPPLREDIRNVVFSFERENEKNIGARKTGEEGADMLVKIHTKTGLIGSKKDVFKAFEEGFEGVYRALYYM